MSKIIRIGTRDSELALWQAKTVQSQLEHLGHKTQLVPVKSTGDLLYLRQTYLRIRNYWCFYKNTWISQCLMKT